MFLAPFTEQADTAEVLFICSSVPLKFFTESFGNGAKGQAHTHPRVWYFITVTVPGQDQDYQNPWMIADGFLASSGFLCV